MAISMNSRAIRRKPMLFVLVLAGLVGLFICSCDDSSQADRERTLREKVEQEFTKTQEEIVATRQLMGIALGVGIAGSAVALIIGTALGSRARRDAKKRQKEVSVIDETGKIP